MSRPVRDTASRVTKEDSPRPYPPPGTQLTVRELNEILQAKSGDLERVIYKEYRNVRQWGCDADNQGDMDKFMQQVDSKEKEIEKLRQDLEKFIEENESFLFPNDVLDVRELLYVDLDNL